MAGCFLRLDLDNFSIKAMVIESGYKLNLIKDVCHVRFKDLADSEENPDPFDEGMDIIAQQIDFQPCSTAIIFVSQLSICFRNIDLPFGSKKKIKQILPFELENLLPVNNEEYISDFHMLDNGKESNPILSASIAEVQVKKYFLKLGSFGIKPLIITPGGYAAAISFLRENKNISTFVFLYVADAEITLVLVNNRQPCMVRSFASSLYSSEDLAKCIKQTIMGFNQRTGTDISFDIFVGSDGDNPGAELIFNDLKRKKLSQVRSKINSNTLLSGISPGKTVKFLFNFCQGDYGSSSFGKKNFKNIAAGLVLFLIAFSLLMVSFGSDNSKLNKKIAGIDIQALSIFKATFPDKKKVQDPYLQMKANVREQIKKSGKSGDKDQLIKNNNFKIVEILGELSRKIASSIDMDTTRFLFNNGRLILSGSTDNFNNVDNIKSNIESSDLFEKVSISSAAADKKGNRVNFKFIIEM
jgi:general secretion pathway protein L